MTGDRSSFAMFWSVQLFSLPVGKEIQVINGVLLLSTSLPLVLAIPDAELPQGKGPTPNTYVLRSTTHNLLQQHIGTGHTV
jgi:hypothetical protein